VITQMLASLPWYDLDELHEATDAFWAILSHNFKDSCICEAPTSLCRDIDYEDQWDNPELLLSQACGYDVILAHAGKLQVVATPRYSAPGCRGNSYRSIVLVREDAPFSTLADLRSTRCVINTRTSHSGMNILRSMVAPLHEDGRFFSSVRISGAHELSVALVLEHEADVTAVDCVTYALLKSKRPASVTGTRILCHTRLCPAPPYVTSANASPAVVEALRLAMKKTLVDPAAVEALIELMISGFDVLPLSAYGPIAMMEERARELTYVELPALAI
jgi:ABC-type phosphate/phosphonate transport system substrate-binding protein